MRTCFECQSLEYDYESDYSDTTPGEGFSIYCTKGKWHFSPAIGGTRADIPRKRFDLRTILRTIDGCSLFEPWEGIEK